MICSTSTFLRFWVVLLMDGLKIPAMSEITFGIISLPFQIHYWDSFLRDTTYLYVGIQFFFLPSTSLIFSPFLSSGFPISSCLLPTPLNWAILVHLFNERTLNFTPCQVLFCHNPDNLPVLMVINFNNGGRSWAANTLFKLRLLHSIETREPGYRRGGWLSRSLSRKDGQESSSEMIRCSKTWPEKTPGYPRNTRQAPHRASASRRESDRWAQWGADRWPAGLGASSEGAAVPRGPQWRSTAVIRAFYAGKVQTAGFPVAQKVKCRPVRSAADPGSIPGLGRSPGEGNGTPLQYSCLENPMDGEAW